MDIFDIFAAASFEYAVYSNLAATDHLNVPIPTGKTNKRYFVFCFLYVHNIYHIAITLKNTITSGIIAT